MRAMLNPPNLSDIYSLLAVQGPLSAKALQSLTSVDLSAIKYYTFTTAEFCGIKDVIISSTGYTGSGGFEICPMQTQILYGNLFLKQVNHLTFNPLVLQQGTPLD